MEHPIINRYCQDLLSSDRYLELIASMRMQVQGVRTNAVGVGAWRRMKLKIGRNRIEADTSHSTSFSLIFHTSCLGILHTTQALPPPRNSHCRYYFVSIDFALFHASVPIRAYTSLALTMLENKSYLPSLAMCSRTLCVCWDNSLLDSVYSLSQS
jgi:hypothetical protein